jgi:hypothetical protein
VPPRTDAEIAILSKAGTRRFRNSFQQYCIIRSMKKAVPVVVDWHVLKPE